MEKETLTLTLKFSRVAQKIYTQFHAFGIAKRPGVAREPIFSIHIRYFIPDS